MSQFIAESDESSQDEQQEWSVKVVLPSKKSKRTLAHLYESSSDEGEGISTKQEKTFSKKTKSKKKTQQRKKSRQQTPKNIERQENELSVPEEAMREPNTPPPDLSSPKHVNPKNADKPILTYATMIAQALSAQTTKRLTLQEIYQWIMDKYPYYKNDEHGWRSSVRHNLSQREYFTKVIENELGKRAVYELNKTHEENLLKGLTGRKLAKHLRKEKEDQDPKKEPVARAKKPKIIPKSADPQASPIQLPFTWFNPTWSYANSSGQLYQPLNLFRPMMQYVQTDHLIHTMKPTPTHAPSQSNVAQSGISCFEAPELDHSMYVTEPPPSPPPEARE
jgi:hypothetical protein